MSASNEEAPELSTKRRARDAVESEAMAMPQGKTEFEFQLHLPKNLLTSPQMFAALHREILGERASDG